MLALQPIVKIEGPPPGVASGRYDVPRPVIAGVGALIAALGMGALLLRLRRWRKP
ncbi:MAG: hypothetical protein RMJ98_09325 [Myxococcales bacterium]|nr:hypothetical protein [Polyangiaceae bacterium]MDW8249487.1 hypothetical protein [Myxococcales bacterium]